MSQFFKIFLIVVLSVFSTLNLSANDTFFSIEQGAPVGNYLNVKSCSSVKELANAGGDVLELTVSAKNHIKYGDVKITIKNSQTGDIISQTTRKVADPPINVPTTGVNVQFNVTGIHFEDILTPGLVEEVAGTRTLVTTLQDGTEVFQSKIKVWVQEANNGEGIWKVLGDEKTWWPSSWTEDKIWSQISQAFNNKTNQYSNLYIGISNNGTKIALRLDDLGNIKTAYIVP